MIKDNKYNLFKSNPKLANVVYEISGIKATIIQNDKSYYRGQVEEPIIDKNGNLVLYGKEDELYKKAGLKSKGVSMTDDLKSAIEYGSGQLEVSKNLASDTYDAEIELDRLSENGYYLIQVNKNVFNEVIKEAGEVKVIGDKIIISKGQYKIEQVIEDIENNQTLQQKQEAQRLYFKYLDTIFPNSKVKDIVHHNSNKKFEKFKTENEKEKREMFKHTGAIFTSDKEYTKPYGGIEYNVLLNIKNPIKNFEGINSTYVAQSYFINKWKEQGIDGVIGKDSPIGVYKLSKGTEYVVFEPEQIHILGSKQDIEGFKRFVNELSCT